MLFPHIYGPLPVAAVDQAAVWLRASWHHMVGDIALAHCARASVVLRTRGRRRSGDQGVLGVEERTHSVMVTGDARDAQNVPRRMPITSSRPKNTIGDGSRSRRRAVHSTAGLPPHGCTRTATDSARHRRRCRRSDVGDPAPDRPADRGSCVTLGGVGPIRFVALVRLLVHRLEVDRVLRRDRRPAEVVRHDRDVAVRQVARASWRSSSAVVVQQAVPHLGVLAARGSAR